MQTVVIDHISVSQRLRAADDDHVAHIALSIDLNGLLNPITVQLTPDGAKPYQLVAGLHRLLACLKLGHVQITAILLGAELGESEIKLIEVDENLCRHELSVMDRIKFLAKRKAVYEILFPKTRHGVYGQKPQEPLSGQKGHSLCFTADSAEKLGISARKIRRDVAVYKALSPIWDAVQSSNIANRATQLKSLSKVRPEQRLVILDKINDASLPLVRKVEDAVALSYGEIAPTQLIKNKIQFCNRWINAPVEFKHSVVSENLAEIKEIIEDVEND